MNLTIYAAEPGSPAEANLKLLACWAVTVGYVVVSAAAMIALFAYVATSSFILESMNGLSPLAYSADFAANAGAMTVTALLSARLVGRVATRSVILVGQAVALAAGLACSSAPCGWTRRCC